MKTKHTLLLSICCFTLCLCSNIYAQNNAQEWGNFNRYAQENTNLIKEGKVEKRVVFIGNSITEGWVNQHPEFFTTNHYIGRGISGQTSFQFLLRFRQDVINLSPEVVVINAATNDIAENTGPYNEDYTFGNIVSMVELAQANNIKVILTTTLPAAAFSWHPQIENVPKKIKALNKRLKKYAKANHIPFVDYYARMVKKRDKSLKPQYTQDGVHPTLPGYKVMESLIKPVIDKTLHQK